MHDTAQIGGLPSSKRNAARGRHDRTLEVTMGMWVHRSQKERRTTEILLRYLLPNELIIKDAYQEPRIDESLSKLGDGNFFTHFGSGFCLSAGPLTETGQREYVRGPADRQNPDPKWVKNYHLRVLRGSHLCVVQERFACDLDLNQWKRIPFGLCHATMIFRRLMFRP